MATAAEFNERVIAQQNKASTYYVRADEWRYGNTTMSLDAVGRETMARYCEKKARSHNSYSKALMRKRDAAAN